MLTSYYHNTTPVPDTPAPGVPPYIAGMAIGSRSLFNQTLNLDGFSGGVYAGWNFDIGNSGFILGIETDLVDNGGSELSP